MRLTTLLLLVLNGGLAALVAFLWDSGQARVREPEHLVVKPLTLPDLADLSSTPLRGVDIAAIRDRAVFHVRRSFYQPPPPSLEIPPPQYELAGTLGLRDGKRVAFVKRKSDQGSLTLHVGEDLDGWHVQDIQPTRVIVVRDSQQSELSQPNAGHDPGIIRGVSTPRIAQSGPRVLSGTGPGIPRMAGTSVSTEARTYRPPPHDQ
jgi:hypothetical protein